MKKPISVAAVLVVALAMPLAAQASEVTHWNRIATSTLAAFPPQAGAPPALTIHMGMVQGAVYDAVNATEPKHYRPYLLNGRTGARASKDAAVATAAYRVLTSIVSGVPAPIPFPNRTALQQGLDAQYAASLANVPDGPFEDQGVRAGEAAAEAMIADRANDGRYGPSPWSMLTGPGFWQPLLNPDNTPMLDPTPWAGDVKPFFLTSPSQFRTPGPNPITSPQYAADFNEVKLLGGINSAARTPVQTHNALFWQSAGGPSVLWNNVAANFVDDPNHMLDTADSARMFAMLNMAGADAAINCWNDKYYWDFWRPWNAIPGAGTDGNPATTADPTWTALLTAPYPEHPSGHLCHDGAQLAVLEHFWGEGPITFGVTSSRFGGETRLFNSFAEPLAEINEARIWAGLHYRTADVQAIALGENVVQYMLDHYFQQVGSAQH